MRSGNMCSLDTYIGLRLFAGHGRGRWVLGRRWPCPLGWWGAGLAGDRLHAERLCRVGAAVVGNVPAQLGRHGLRHDQDSHPHPLGHALDRRQTRIALAALNLRQMLWRHAHLRIQVRQRQTTLIALAAQEGGDQGFRGGSAVAGEWLS